MTARTDQTPRPAISGAIVVGVDESPNAVNAAAFARTLARRTGVPCHLVHVAEPGRDPIGAGLRIREALAAANPPIPADDLEVRIGDAPDVIVTRAEQLGACLIILGGKNHSILGRWVAGSTAVAVVRESRIPVLVTRGPLGMLTRVLVGADATEAAFSAIRHAEDWSELWNADLRLVHAVPLPPLLPEYSTGYDLEMLRVQGLDEAEREIFPLIGREGTEKVVEVGGPAEVLSMQARNWPADLLVVTRHDRGWLSRAALGSVTERLLDGLPTSMLVVPASRVAELKDATKFAEQEVTS